MESGSGRAESRIPAFKNRYKAHAARVRQQWEFSTQITMYSEFNALIH